MKNFCCSTPSAFTSFFSLALMLSACGEKQGDVVGRDPNIPISVKQPEDQAPSENTPPALVPPPAAGTSQPQPPSDNPNPAPAPVGDETKNNPEPTPRRATLTIAIKDLRNTKGNFCLSLFNSPDGFPDSGEKALVAECFAISENSFSVKIENLTAGRYAIAGWHDENKDKQLNRNLVGIPKEGMAFSENGKPILPPNIPGPPPFDSISFEIGNEDRTTEMKTCYLLPWRC